MGRFFTIEKSCKTVTASADLKPGKNGMPQLSHRIDPFLPTELLDLPQSVVDADVNKRRASLAVRNMERGVALNLPSGQAVARKICAGDKIYTNAELGLKDFDGELGGETPLWYYILGEAQKEAKGGQHLGTVGATIVGETLLGLLKTDPDSYLNAACGWTPIFGKKKEGKVDKEDKEKKTFTMADLLCIAATVTNGGCGSDKKKAKAGKAGK